MRKYVVLGVVPTLCAATTSAFGRPCPYTNVTPISPRKVPFLADLDNASLIRISLKLCYERFSYLALDELEDQDDFSARDNQMMMVSSADPSSLTGIHISSIDKRQGRRKITSHHDAVHAGEYTSEVDDDLVRR